MWPNHEKILVHSLNTPVYAMEHVKVNREDSLGY
jgi:hypothetical protein